MAHHPRLFQKHHLSSTIAGALDTYYFVKVTQSTISGKHRLCPVLLGLGSKREVAGSFVGVSGITEQP